SSDQQETRSTRARRHNRRHSLALHRGSLLDLAELFKSSQDFVHDPTAFIDVGKLSATEKHVYQNFVFLLKEFLGPLDLYFDIVLAGLGSDPDFLDVNLVLLLLAEFLLLGIFEFAIVDDLAHGRTLVGSDLNQVEASLARSLESFARGHYAEHGTFGVDYPHG